MLEEEELVYFFHLIIRKSTTWKASWPNTLPKRARRGRACTFFHYSLGKVQHGKHPGQTPYLNMLEEEELVHFYFSVLKLTFLKWAFPIL